jgi:streptogrisin D
VAASLLIGVQLVAAGGQPAVGLAATPEAAIALGRQLDSPGVYRDTVSGRMVVTVTTQDKTGWAKADGVIVRVVARSNATLNAATVSLERDAAVPGTAWGVDPITNQVVLSIDSSVTGPNLAKVRAVAARLGDAVRAEYVPGVFSPAIAGGDAIYNANGIHCSLGFNVHDSAHRPLFLTAGHCGNIASSWYADQANTVYLGKRILSSYPVDDYAVYQYDPSVKYHYGKISNGQDISGWALAYVGQPVSRTGMMTGTRGGIVTRVNLTVNYGSGPVYQLVETTACGEKGDSGGPFYAGVFALGLLSGGVGDCRSGGFTLFQPISEPMQRLNLHVY